MHHEQPKQLRVKALVKQAPKQLRADQLPAAWAVVENRVKPRCTAQSAALKALTDHLSRIPEYRSPRALGFPLAGMLTLIAAAVFCGVVRGKKDLAAFAKTLSEAQRRALRFRRDKQTGRVRCPGVTTCFRILNEVDEQALELALLADRPTSELDHGEGQSLRQDLGGHHQCRSPDLES
jgi:hypothetical protein